MDTKIWIGLIIISIALVLYGLYWLGKNQDKIIEMREEQRKKLEDQKKLWQDLKKKQ